MGWPPDETIVRHAGAMGTKQGLENVVDAAALADEQNRPIRFVLLVMAVSGIRWRTAQRASQN
jgi:hypothetical protein